MINLPVFLWSLAICMAMSAVVVYGMVKLRDFVMTCMIRQVCYICLGDKKVDLLQSFRGKPFPTVFRLNPFNRPVVGQVDCPGCGGDGTFTSCMDRVNRGG